MRARKRWSAGVTSVLIVAGTLTACTSPPPTPTPPTMTKTTPHSPIPTAPSTARTTPHTQVQPSGQPVTVQSGLKSPWSMLRLPSGSTLISERDSGLIRELLPGGGSIRDVGTVPAVVHDGEGGLLGLAAPTPKPGANPDDVYAYLTTANDNRVVRMPLHGAPGSYALGAPQEILTGIPKAANHDGGRLAFGPDGMLYLTTGDATGGDNAQNLKSLAGKILRLTPTGGVPADNPFPGSPVYSLGHRNPQGIAWDSRGTMWASEFGQNTWDELNIITPGADYGWPIVEGIGHKAGFVDPVYQWKTSDASPSGITIIDDTIFIAGLGGRRLWAVYPTAGGPPVQAVSWFAGTLGRIRDVAPAPAGSLWILTNNTDGRGTPTPATTGSCRSAWFPAPAEPGRTCLNGTERR